MTQQEIDEKRGMIIGLIGLVNETKFMMGPAAIGEMLQAALKINEHLNAQVEPGGYLHRITIRYEEWDGKSP